MTVSLLLMYLNFQDIYERNPSRYVMEFDKENLARDGRTHGVYVAPSKFVNAGLGLFCATGDLQLFNMFLYKFSDGLENACMLGVIFFFFTPFKHHDLSCSCSTDLKEGHEIPFYGILFVQKVSPKNKDEPVTIIKSFTHLRDRIICLPYQPVVPKRNATVSIFILITSLKYTDTHEIITALVIFLPDRLSKYSCMVQKIAPQRMPIRSAIILAQIRSEMMSAHIKMKGSHWRTPRGDLGPECSYCCV